MNKDEAYYFHQTPEQLAIDLLKEVPIETGDTIFEPFKGEGAFYKNFPTNTTNLYTEIQEGSDYRDYDELKFDWVISNPPFRLENDLTNKRENAFFKILNHFADKVNKGIAFLGNDYCFSALTPKRMRQLNEKGLYIHNVVVCSVKKWRGRYFFIIFKKEQNNTFKYLQNNY
jgi:hypothetical protein